MDAKFQFHSFLLVEEKLLEAEYFVRCLSRRDGYEFGFELNAFLSAARSVTFLVQKEFSKVGGFKEWWKNQQVIMRQDAAMRFFLELRNFSQKEGRVSILSQNLTSRRWSHWFVSGKIVVPEELRDVDVVDACRLHLAKLSRLVLDCADNFPFHSCPHRALTPDGIRALRLNLDILDLMLGYTKGFSRIEGYSLEDRLRLLRRHFDGVDFVEIERLANLKPRRQSRTNQNRFITEFHKSFRSRMHPYDETNI